MSQRRIDFEAMIDNGEAPYPKQYDEYAIGPPGARRSPPPKPEPGANFTAQTVNGTAHTFGTGHNCEYDYEMPQVRPDATRPAGRSNRTGE